MSFVTEMAGYRPPEDHVLQTGELVGLYATDNGRVQVRVVYDEAGKDFLQGMPVVREQYDPENPIEQCYHLCSYKDKEGVARNALLVGDRLLPLELQQEESVPFTDMSLINGQTVLDCHKKNGKIIDILMFDLLGDEVIESNGLPVRRVTHQKPKPDHKDLLEKGC